MPFSNILGNLLATGATSGNDPGQGGGFFDQLHAQVTNPNPQGAPQDAPQAESSGIFGTNMGFGQLAGLAGIAALGYKAYTSHQEKQQERAAWATQGGQPAAQDGGLLSRIGGMFGSSAEHVQQQIPTDSNAMLLIKALIAACAADGQITVDERDGIMRQVWNSNPTQQEASAVEGLLQNPPTIDEVIGQVRDSNTAEQVYYTCCIGMQRNSSNAFPFLGYVAQRLNIPQERQNMIQQAVYSGAVTTG